MHSRLKDAPPGGAPAAAQPQLLDPTASYQKVRRATLALCEPLSPEDSTPQSMPDASPAKWHLAHTTWFFETFVLREMVRGYEVFRPGYEVLFNSYYNSVGEQYPRPRRGLVTRPSLEEVRAYRAYVDAAVTTLLESGTLTPGQLAVVELGLHHEQQHQELILTDVKHLLSFNPLAPAYAPAASRPGAGPPAVSWIGFEEGLRWIGHGGGGFAFDNEGPRHKQWIGAFQLASHPVTNGQYLEFMRDGGYGRAELWLSDGWDAVRREGWQAPLYWRANGSEWMQFTLSGLREVDPGEPVTHVSYYEADAFARWAGARLPTESEWEVAAGEAAPQGNFVESGFFHPAPASGDPQPGAPAQMLGDVWEWTQSAYAAYPGYKPAPGALGEYNGKFMCNQMVLKGGSCATPLSHIRATYRNFFYPTARWQFSGLRMARDCG